MSLIQYILLALVLMFIIRQAFKLKKRKIHSQDFIMWFVFWCFVGVIVIFPNVTQVAADFLGVGRGVDLVIYISLLFLFFAIYQLLVMIKNIDQKVTQLGRSIALSEAKDLTKKESDDKE